MTGIPYNLIMVKGRRARLRVDPNQRLITPFLRANVQPFKALQRRIIRRNSAHLRLAAINRGMSTLHWYFGQCKLLIADLVRYTDKYGIDCVAVMAFVTGKMKPLMEHALWELDQLHKDRKFRPKNRIVRALMKWDPAKGYFNLFHWDLSNSGTIRLFSKIWKWGKFHEKKILIQSLRTKLLPLQQTQRQPVRAAEPQALSEDLESLELSGASPERLSTEEDCPLAEAVVDDAAPEAVVNDSEDTASTVPTTLAATGTYIAHNAPHSASGFASTAHCLVTFNGRAAELLECDRQWSYWFHLSNYSDDHRNCVFAVSVDGKRVNCWFPAVLVRVELREKVDKYHYPLDQGKTRPGVIEINSELLVFGGIGSNTCHRYAFPARAIQSTAIASMRRARADFQPCHYRGQVYLVGGGSHLCEIYSLVDGDMKGLHSPLPELASGIQFASVSDDVVYFGRAQDGLTTVYRADFHSAQLVPFADCSDCCGVVVVGDRVYFGNSESVRWSTGRGYEARRWTISTE